MPNGNDNGARRRMLEQVGLTTGPLLAMLLWIGSTARDERAATLRRFEETEIQLHRIERRLSEVERDTDRVERRTRFLPQSGR